MMLFSSGSPSRVDEVHPKVYNNPPYAYTLISITVETSLSCNLQLLSEKIQI